MSANSLSPADTPHLLIPFAACSAPAWLPAVQALPPASTRQMVQLLRSMKPLHTDEADAHTLSPPHERALARALDLAAPDGLIPWAEQDAAEHLQAEGGKAWAWLTPCHWAMGREHATLTDPAALGLREDESRALLAAMQPYFETEGITLHYAPALGPARWLAEGELFRRLPTASLDRVLGRNVDPWLPRPTADDTRDAARKMKLLQNEMQMLLYTHPLNDSRAAQRQLPVNSFWVSGTGVLPDGLRPSGVAPRMPRALAQAVFSDDWQAYAHAWAALDATELAPLLARQRAGEAVRLTLCGERNAITFETGHTSLFAKMTSLLAPTPLSHVLQQL